MKGIFTALHDSLMKYTWLGYFQDKKNVAELQKEIKVLKERLGDVEAQLLDAKQGAEQNESKYVSLCHEHNTTLVEIHANRSIINQIKSIVC